MSVLPSDPRNSPGDPLNFPPNLRTLDTLKQGERGIIVSVEGDDGVAVRLMEMGLVEGEPIQVLGAAPLGDPVEYSIQGYRLSLRKTESRRVVVN